MAEREPVVQALRNQMVRRLPSPHDLARRPPLALTGRDQAILAAIATHGFLTVELVELAFFPSPRANEPAAGSRATKRLRRFWLAGLVERVELPVSRVLGGRRAFVYALTDRGAAFAAAALGVSVSSISLPRLDRKDTCWSDHDRHAATVWARMRALSRSAGLGECRWTAERELRARNMRVRDPATGGSWQVVPDGYAELDYPDGTVQCCMVEVDLGSVGLARFGRKLRGMELYLAQGLYARDWGRRGFEVLVLTHSKERLDHLWDVGRRVVPSSSWPWYSFALLDALESQERFGGRVWRTLRGDDTGLLYDRPPAGVPARSGTDTKR